MVGERRLRLSELRDRGILELVVGEKSRREDLQSLGRVGEP